MLQANFQWHYVLRFLLSKLTVLYRVLHNLNIGYARIHISLYADLELTNIVHITHYNDNSIIIICDIYKGSYSARSCSKALYNIIYNIIIPDSDLFPPSRYLNSQGSIYACRVDVKYSNINHYFHCNTRVPSSVDEEIIITIQLIHWSHLRR